MISTCMQANVMEGGGISRWPMKLPHHKPTQWNVAFIYLGMTLQTAKINPRYHKVQYFEVGPRRLALTQ